MEEVIEHIGSTGADVDDAGLNGKSAFTDDGLALKRRLSVDNPESKKAKQSDDNDVPMDVSNCKAEGDSLPAIDKNGENGASVHPPIPTEDIATSVASDAVVVEREDEPAAVVVVPEGTDSNPTVAEPLANGNSAVNIPEPAADTSVLEVESSDEPDAGADDDSAAIATADTEEVIDLDTTLETSVVVEAQSTTDGDEDANDTAVVEADSAANINAKVPDTKPAGVEPEVVAIDDAPSAMDVTLDEEDKTLETPNVSVCPAGQSQPLLAPHSRISELVLSNGSSTPNTSNPTSVEFQATPIKKADEGSLTAGQLLEEEKVLTDASASSLDEKIEAGLKCLREITELANGPTTTDCSAQSDVDEKVMDVTGTVSAPDLFDTAVNFANGTLQCLVVERVIRPLPIPSEISSDAASEKSGSNGSTTSLGPFALPSMLTHTHSGLSVSSTSSASSRPFASAAGEKSRVQGVSGLRAFLQDLLKKLPEEEKKKPGRVPKSKAAAAASKTAERSAIETDKKVVAFEAESQVGNFVMARWPSDKKYYAGRVNAEKPGHKYLINFEDGANKTLSKDQIVFGNQTVVPLLNFEVNVLVEPNVYETGVVVAIDPDAASYNVMTNSGQVTVLASDMYLDEEQAKAVQQSYASDGEAVAGRARTSLEAPATSGPGRRKRNSDVLTSSPKAGPSNVSEAAAKKFKKRPLQFQSSDTQLSDLSDTFDSEPAAAKVVEVSFLEAVDGVQPELTKCPIQAKINLTCGYYKDEWDADKLGDVPTNAALFRDKHVILTATSVVSPREDHFTDYPFVMEHLLKQLQCGGATVYGHFEDIPKAKYKTCILITKHPCLTARYIQCLAANITIVHHGWVIDSCRQNRLQDLRAYTLPAGFSMLEDEYVRYVTGRNEKRTQARPFSNLSILLSSENAEFINFWTRVCKFADAKVVKAINSVLDITSQGKKTYMLTDSELQVANVEKAKAVGIHIVSTAWVNECLVQGKLLQPEDHVNFTKANWDLQS